MRFFYHFAVTSVQGRTSLLTYTYVYTYIHSYTLTQGRSQEFTKGANQGVWETEVTGGVLQGQNMETLENTNGAVTKSDGPTVTGRGMHPCPSGYALNIHTYIHKEYSALIKL